MISQVCDTVAPPKLDNDWTSGCGESSKLFVPIGCQLLCWLTSQMGKGIRKIAREEYFKRMIFACPLLLLKYCANILLDRELGPIPVYTLRRCLPSSRAFKMHLCAFYSPVFGDRSCTWYSYWVMVLYKNRKIFFSFDFILQIAHSQSFYFIFVCVCL